MISKNNLVQLQNLKFFFIQKQVNFRWNKSLFKKSVNSILPISAIRKPFAYLLKRWDKLAKYVELGQVEIDKNLVENVIRPIALGRKNYLFSGSHESAQRAAMIYSLLETCKINNINPMEWLHDILLRIDDHPNNQIEAFASTQLDKSLVRNLICTSLDGYDIKWIHLS